ncbi:GON-4-like protein [Osmerus eperlanus]|uniref:GON-4-like protein n=1 Tax=Osmerus eperlanus TaxID=29151 RepID=UPI002E13B427
MVRKRKYSSPEPLTTHSKVQNKNETVCELQVSNGVPPTPKKMTVSAFSPTKESGIGVPDVRIPQSTTSPMDVEECLQSSSPSHTESETEEDDAETGLVITLDGEGCGSQKTRRKNKRVSDSSQGEGQPGSGFGLQTLSSQDSQSQSDDEFGQLDIDLERKSKQHNLTSVHIRTILHEVITNKHVVAMMKEAIKETQDMPMFEPKMTRSRLKQVVGEGAIPTWNISPIKRVNEPPQFVDIPLEEEEDSSDEEYCPDEDDEDEMAEETFLSDVDSTSSSPRCAHRPQPSTPVQSSPTNSSPRQKPRCSRHLRVAAVPMGPPPPPPSSSGPPGAMDSTFMEKLHAVEEELALSSVHPETYQALGGGAAGGLVACRTRSKRPLRDVPLGQLEAELRAPDITPDMYDCDAAMKDRHWSEWLQGLMTSDMENDEDGDDDDDPEYNFLEDLHEPDREDYRTDRAVRITKKEVNELLEELFETFQDELGGNEGEGEGHEEDEEREEEAPSQSMPKFNVPQAIRFEAPLASMLSERRRAVREQYEALQQRRALQDTPTHTPSLPSHVFNTTSSTTPLVLFCPQARPQARPALTLDSAQKAQLQLQVQQHVQLLTQLFLLCSPVEALHHQACTTQQYLEELQTFARRQEGKGAPSVFRVCNLKGALSLIAEQEIPCPKPQAPPNASLPPRTHPSSFSKSRTYAQLPATTAWLLATRPVFLYPELLPLCSLDPALHRPRTKNHYTRGEESLIVLGLEHFKDTQMPHYLMCQYLIRKHSHSHLRTHIKEMLSPKAPHNIFKLYYENHVLPAMPLACGRVMPGEERPPVERGESIMPNWLKKSLPVIHKAVMAYNKANRQDSDEESPVRSYTFPRGTQYPPSLPRNVRLRLHPHMNDRVCHPPIAPKPRPIHGFTPTGSLAPLAKAPLAKAPLAKAPTEAPSFLSHIPGPIPSHGVILLANAPSTPFQGILPLVTPAHGEVASGLMQIKPATPTGSHLIGQGVISTCVMSTPTETACQQMQQRKLLPIHPAPLKENPTVSFSTDPQTGPWLPWRIRRPPTSNHRAKAREAALARQRTPARPILPAPPSPDLDLSCTSTLPDYGLQSAPLFLSHAPSPPLLPSQLTTSPINPSLSNQNCSWRQPVERSEVRGVVEPSSANSQPHGSQTNSLSLHGNTIVPDPSAQGASTERNSDYVLLQMTSNGSTQTFWVPQYCLTLNTTHNDFQQLGSEPGLSPAPQQQLAPLTSGLPSGLASPASAATQQEAPLDCDLPNATAGQSLEEQLYQLVEGLKDGAIEEEKEGEEEGEEEEEEEERGGWGNLEGPLLTLSASSGSPCSSLDSRADALERMMADGMEGGRDEMEEEEKGYSLAEEERMELGLERGSGMSEVPPHAPPEEDLNREEQEKRAGKGGHHTTPDMTRAGRETPGGSGGEGERNEGEEEGEEEGEGGEGEGSGGGGDDGNGGRGEGDGEQRGEGEGGSRGEGEEEGEGAASGGEKDEEKDGDGDPERQGDEEEEEDFDDLTQDEDEEEVMSSASEESVLSVPELQETMKKLTWLASEGRLCGEGDSEEDASPNSPVSQNSQEENSDEEEEGPGAKGEGLEPGEGGVSKAAGDEDAPQGEDAPRAGGKAAGRGRGRGRPPPRGLRRARRQERDSKDASKLLLLYDDHILDNDPLRESKDNAFAQAYLNRVRETLQDVPGKVEEFLGLLYEFEQGGEGRSVVDLFTQLRGVLADRTELLRDFAAFLLPDQALECGLFEEQQAFERSRRFLRQLEISFGENPSHYQKIVKALQGGPSLRPASIEELKALMSSLLKGHTHLQGEFGVFFDELRPPPARPGQFEEACWPEEGGVGVEGSEGAGLVSGGGASSGFEEVTLPDLEEEEEGQKIPLISARSRRRKMGSIGNYKECDWPEKDCSCLCHDAKLRRHKRKGCSRCHINKAPDGVSRAIKSLDPLYPASTSPTAELPTDGGGEEREEEKEDEKEEEPEEEKEEEAEEEKEVDSEVKDEIDSGANSPLPAQGLDCWEGTEEGSLPLTEEREEEDEEMEEEVEEVEEWKDGKGETSPSKKSRVERSPSGVMETPPQPRPSPPSDPPVCAKNISLTASGEKVILWTRQADRVILTTCQLQGANQSTFQAISTQLGNKTPNEVSRRFRDLMHLFHTAARQVNSKDEAVATEQQAATDEELE